ncbi:MULTISPECIES: cyclic nucleotide-binding domain-containing protein [Rhizobium/Agrobacterium group]|uniref:cAMP-dependent protein kinase regulatory subunit n=2 Tax=Rhizobium/Agrobacterium group TaxID=227290 RepID=B9K1F4_ALLAM|nr:MULTISPECIES: cyclic nucleotide-binding domain-containing protein [Rhizobium/Agrobacterium group]MCF1497142.1 cyclic nucleotide-binding domain-containing protein [Allorhizobium sp. Av2]ACM38702.1 cAMP-dependent protein kinase regulatory subunit [Allorhizobium ampelinum S4]KAA3518555.1 cyclic nucleotide-binding domain-containing protein [Agrobacterium vitis]KAA3530151.1 cyclic nucleotide-binding domain-containing protein [Agrobacterium vitis]MBF2713511.1 cyclic nucleotide-binding domain-cont
MLLKDEVEMLRRVPLFSQIAPAKLKLLAFASDRMTCREGQNLFRQGDVGDAAYVVLSGTADVLVNSDAGEIKVAEVQSNSIVGEIAILCDVSRTATVRAASRLEVLKISKENFLKLMSDFPEISSEITRVLADRLNHTTSELSAARSREQQLLN